MSKNILIAGKDYPACDDFVNSFSLGGYNVVTTGKSDTNLENTNEIQIASWNKDSPISARSLIIEAETKNGFNENYILYFDASWFASIYQSTSTDVCSRAADSMILGFQYLSLEIIKRIEQHKTQGKLFFILKSHPTCLDMQKSSLYKKTNLLPASALVAAGEAAFATFAENLACNSSQYNYANIFLVTGDSQNETISKDSNLASWLKDYIETLDNSKKGLSKSANWIKAGSKAPGNFSLFSK